MAVQTMLTITVICTCMISLCFAQCDQRPYGGKMKCCLGKDANCFVKVRDSRSRLLSRKICYCDEFCKYTGDCCGDYEQIQKECHGQVDCKVGEWGDYSECSSSCGFGVMTRKRAVLQSSQNGGKQCPPLVQVKGCHKGNLFCNLEIYETGFILPISFRRPAQGTWKYEKILPAPVESNYVSNTIDTYCLNYKLVTKREQCAGTWADEMNEGKPLCIECQPQAMRDGRCKGEGATGVQTRWKALKVHRCHGDWIRLGPAIPNCECKSDQFANFVFV